MVARDDAPRAVAPSEAPPTLVGVPAGVADAARAAFDAVDRSAHLAELVRDSLDDPRSDASERHVSFAFGDLEIDAVLGRDAGQDRRLTVQVRPVPSGSLSVESRGSQSFSAVSTEPGSWIVEPAPSGPVSLLVEDGDRRVRTTWVLL